MRWAKKLQKTSSKRGTLGVTAQAGPGPKVGPKTAWHFRHAGPKGSILLAEGHDSEWGFGGTRVTSVQLPASQPNGRPAYGSTANAT